MKKYAPYIFILIIILVGLFSPTARVNASAYSDCFFTTGGDLTLCRGKEGDPNLPPTASLPVIPIATLETTGTSTITGQPLTTPATEEKKSKPAPSEFDKWATDESCGIIGESSVAGCIKAIFYYVVYTPSAVLLSIAAQFFNALISIALSSKLFSTSGAFLSTAWGVVRDLSNIFFILILLYIAVKVILGLGGSDVKKMITKVIIIALLINFSMFFTQVIIDTSNILALIFYNKLEVTYKDPKTGEPIARPYKGATGAGERDLSGTMYSGFDITSKLDSTFWAQTKSMSPDSNGQPQTQVPVGTMVGIMVVASAIMLFAAYAFLVSGIAFVARVIELFVLIIFSPFAFMSSTVPLLSGVDYLGWDTWFKRLLKVAFMAPIFMFFMYLIFLLLSKNLFSSLVTVQQDWVQTILGVIVPGMMILVLLLQATKWAKKASGEIGEAIFKGAKMVGGFALGAATGGAALLGAGAIGGLASRAASNESLNTKAKEKGFGGMAARMALGTADYGSKATFDVRKIPGVGSLAKMGGINLESAKGIGLGSKEGGYQQRRKEQVDKRQKRAKELEVREDEPMKQALNHSEIDLQQMLNKTAKDFEKIDKELEAQRQAKNDALKDSVEEKSAAANIKELLAQKAALRTGTVHTGKMLKADGTDDKTTKADGTAYVVADGKNAGKTMKQLQTEVIPDQKNAIITENRERKVAYAERIVKWGGNGIRTDREAAHKIIMEAKLPESGAKA